VTSAHEEDVKSTSLEARVSLLEARLNAIEAASCRMFALSPVPPGATREEEIAILRANFAAAEFSYVTLPVLRIEQHQQSELPPHQMGSGR